MKRRGHAGGRGDDPVRTDFQHYLGGLNRGTPGPGAVAFFDLDRTVIAGYSLTALAWERIISRTVSLRHMLSSAGALIGYGLGRADYHELLSTTVRDLAGESELALTGLGERAFRRVQGWIYAEARALIEAHRREGHYVVIVTSATRFQSAPVARYLNVDQLCCTELEIVDGRMTGHALPCFGEGKLSAAERVLRERRESLARAYFYSDSSDDLPLLEAVGRPVVVNPKIAMARLAVTRGWPCLYFDPPGDVSPAAA